LTHKEWIDYLSISNYYTPNEIEYRKQIILNDGIDYDKLINDINSYRKRNKKSFKIYDEEFYFVETKWIKKELGKIKKYWKDPSNLLQKKFLKNLLIDTLIAEAFHSSSIEGAHSTKKRTEEIIKKNLKPKNKSEIMIMNNFRALEYIKDKNNPIDEKMILKLHSIVSNNTVKENEKGVFRNDAVDIVNQHGKVIFTPTGNIKKMQKMIKCLIDFVNSEDDGIGNDYIEKIYKIIIFHFLFGYIHPFFDGNGRVVRILFAYLLKNNEYDMFFYISLSEIINNGKNRKKYEEAFLKTERNGNDLTYFFYFMIDVMKEALETLKKRIFLYLKEDIIKEKIRQNNFIITKKQEIIIKIISKEHNNYIHIDTISKKMKLSKQTVRKHLKTLIDYKLINKKRIGRKVFYELNIT